MKLKTIKMLFESPDELEKAINKKGVKKLRKAVLKAYSKEIRKILIPTKDLNFVLPLFKKEKPQIAAEFERLIEPENPDATEKEELEALIKASCIF